MNSRVLTIFAVGMVAAFASAAPAAASSSVKYPVTATIGMGSDPYGVAVNPDTHTIYVANDGSGTVSVINGRTSKVTATIQVGSNPDAVAVNPDTNTIYVTNVGTGVEGAGKWGAISVINGQTETVSATISLGKSQPDAVAVNPDTSTIYATAGPIPPTPNQGTGGVSVINGRTDKVTATIAGGEGEVTINPDTNTIFATNEGSNTVSVANGRTNKVTATTKVGSSPDGVAVNPATRRIYVANFSGGTVSVITPQP